MAKLSVVFSILLLLFTSGAWDIVMVVASNSLPQEDMRIICDAECSSRCKNSHPGGNGFCVNDKVCRCYYNMNIETDYKINAVGYNHTCQEVIPGKACEKSACNKQCLLLHGPSGNGLCIRDIQCRCRYNC